MTVRKICKAQEPVVAQREEPEEERLGVPRVVHLQQLNPMIQLRVASCRCLLPGAMETRVDR